MSMVVAQMDPKLTHNITVSKLHPFRKFHPVQHLNYLDSKLQDQERIELPVILDM
jgi:hypothetical protein